MKPKKINWDARDENGMITLRKKSDRPEKASKEQNNLNETLPKNIEREIGKQEIGQLNHELSIRRNPNDTAPKNIEGESVKEEIARRITERKIRKQENADKMKNELINNNNKNFGNGNEFLWQIDNALTMENNKDLDFSSKYDIPDIQFSGNARETLSILNKIIQNASIEMNYKDKKHVKQIFVLYNLKINEGLRFARLLSGSEFFNSELIWIENEFNKINQQVVKKKSFWS